MDKTVDEVIVGLKTYKIEKPQEIVEVGGEYYGACDNKESIIKIASKFSPLQQQETLLHEVLHAICHMQNLMDIDSNEHAIELLAKGLHMVMKQNPHVFTLAEVQ